MLLRAFEDILLVKDGMGELFLEAIITKELLYPWRQKSIFEHLVDVRPTVRILSNQLVYQSSQFIREIRRQRRKLPSNYLHCKHVDIATVEGRFERAHFVQKHSKRPHIALKVIWLVLDDLGTQVVWRAHNRHRLFNCAIKDFCNTKITQLHDTILHEKYVSGLEISMQNFPIMTVLHGEANLSEPVEDGVLREQIISTSFLCFFDFASEISSICIVHNNAQLSFLSFIDFPEMNDIGMVENLQNLRFLDSIFLFLLRHAGNINLLDHSITAIALCLHQKCLTKRALANDFDLLV